MRSLPCIPCVVPRYKNRGGDEEAKRRRGEDAPPCAPRRAEVKALLTQKCEEFRVALVPERNSGVHLLDACVKYCNSTR